MINNNTYSYLKKLNLFHINPDKTKSVILSYDDYIKTNVHNDNKNSKYFVKLYK